MRESNLKPDRSDWTGYFDAQAGRSVRPLLVHALEARAGAPAGRAIDLGCGEGTETRHLLANGWRVHAFDGDPAAELRVRAGLNPDQLERLRFTQITFEQLDDLPPADLIHSGFALPFCAEVAFPSLWKHVRSALLPGAFLAAELFGPHDEWAGRADMNFHDRGQVDALLAGLTVHSLVEEDRLGASSFGPKHWHVFHLIAEQPVV